MEQKTKIKKILEANKFEINNIEQFEVELKNILNMFEQIKEVNVDGVSSTLDRKKIHLNDLRTDKSTDWGFKPEMRGKYFKVPNVSKK